MGKNFLGLDGLKHFWSKAKTWIAEQITAEVTAKIAEIIANAPEDLDTLKEIADWISAHANDAAAMNMAISTNTSDIATLKTSVAGKSDTGHTHTKSQITDFPTSLPANGGTADSANNGFNSSTTTDSTPGWGYLTSGNGYSNGRTYNFANGGGIATAEKDTKSSLQVDGDLYVHEGLDKVATLNDIPTSLPANGGTADKTVNDITIDIPYVAESGQYVIPLGNILEPTSTEINSPYNWDITGFFSVIRNSGHNGSHIQFEAGHGYSHNWTTYAYLDKLDFNFITTSIKAFQYNGKWWLGLYIFTEHQNYAAKMTITYSRGLPATPTCVLYYSVSNGVANEEIYNSIQDIPSSWWGQRTICNPTTFNDDIFVHNKSLFPSGYIPRTYFIERATKDNITAEQKELLRKMFAYQSVNRLIQCYGLLSYRVNTSEKYFGGRVVTVGYFDGDDWLDSNENISYDDNSNVNYACFGVQDDGNNIDIVDMFNLSENVMRNKFESLNYLSVYRLYFTVLEKI